MTGSFEYDAGVNGDDHRTWSRLDREFCSYHTEYWNGIVIFQDVQ